MYDDTEEFMNISSEALTKLICDAYDERVADLLSEPTDKVGSIERLTGFVNDPDPAVRRAASQVLMELRIPDAVNAISAPFTWPGAPEGQLNSVYAKTCLSIPRIVDLQDNPKLMTAEERAHIIGGCRFCQKALRTPNHTDHSSAKTSR